MRKNKTFSEKYFTIFKKYPRHYFVFGFFVIIFIIILSKVFTYTINDNDFYKKFADKQQI
jgi:cell division protein FtsI/penicillin-binding protein 2